MEVNVLIKAGQALSRQLKALRAGGAKTTGGAAPNGFPGPF
jgi:hypothetical protein